MNFYRRTFTCSLGFFFTLLVGASKVAGQVNLSAIGVNFTNKEESVWAAELSNGYLLQENWNHVVAGNIPASFTNAVAETTTMNLAIEAVTPGGLLQYRDKAQITRLEEQLTSTYVRNAKVTLTGIPYADYDLYVYGTNRLNFDAIDIQLAPGTAEEITLTGFTARSSIKPFKLAGRSRPETRPGGNVFRFRGLTSDTLVFQAIQNVDAGGIAGFQIVDTSADADSDQMPDWWELKNGTDPGSNDSAADTDADQLTHLDEFLRETDPNHPDSDGDGLGDFVETHTGTYLSSQNTGTDPNYADSDDDGLSDSLEVFSATSSNPLLVDTDSDGTPDAEEIFLGTLPGNADDTLVPLPQTNTTTSLVWEVPNIQLQWNHKSVDGLAEEVSDERIFAAIGIQNLSADVVVINTYTPDLIIGLKTVGNQIVAFFQSRRNGAFTRVANSDFITQGVTDLTPNLGFSGSGERDFSDPLSFRVEATKANGGDTWIVTYTLRNQGTSEILATETLNDLNAHSSINQGTSVWRTNDALDENMTPPVRFNFETGREISVFLKADTFDSLEAFADIRDVDNDGLPDLWEQQNSVNDPDGDADSDGVSNRLEFILGTNPNANDSDADGQSDFVEWQNFTNANESSIYSRKSTRNFVLTDDFNGNGMSDTWEASYRALGRLQPDTDPDLDGQSNLQESIAGTDPFDPRSVISLNITAGDDSSSQLSWTTLPFKRNQIWFSENLTDPWASLTGVPTVTAQQSRLEVVRENEGQFYRLNVENLDSDSDGVFDSTEAFLGTNPLVFSSSGRPLQQDFDNDGAIDRTVSADFLKLQEKYENHQNFQTGGGSEPTRLSSREAARFLLQASFGPRVDEIALIQNQGIPSWIEEQMSLPSSSYQAEIEKLFDDSSGAKNLTSYLTRNVGRLGDPSIASSQVPTAFANIAIKGEDQLRQRMVFALSQIFVVSYRDTNIAQQGATMLANYCDTLSEHAFGNFRDLLEAVARHPAMGIYLSHLGNKKADPGINRFPDENFAREIMQLFTIGLYQLNQDGTLVLDNEGNRIETYDQEDIREMARVMTGLDLRGRNPFAPGQGSNIAPMLIYPDDHDFGEKRILKRFTIVERESSRENADLNFDEALQVLFEHENTAPFFSSALIRFFVTDNPSAAYVERMADVFDDDGTGTRGNIGALIKAILLDPEARDIPAADNTDSFGRLRAPALRTMHLARLLQMQRHLNLAWWEDKDDRLTLQGAQVPLHAPTVFNFYLPDHKPLGLLGERGLVSGPFQMIDTISSISFPNLIWEMATEGFVRDRGNGNSGFYRFPPFYDTFMPYAGDNAALVDLVDIVACGGRMEPASKATILQSLDTPFYQNPANQSAKIALALYGAFIIPESAIIR